jgi:hypothetical protein
MLTALTLLSSLALADGKEAEECLRTKIWEGYSQGWAVRTVANANIADRGHKVYQVTLYKGNEYKMMACGDRDSKNVDLVLYDKSGNAVQRETTDNRDPWISFTPSATDTFYVAVFNTQPGTPGKAVDIATAVTFK